MCRRSRLLDVFHKIQYGGKSKLVEELMGSEANLVIGRRDTIVQNLMSVKYTGLEIQPFKVRNFERSL